MMAVAIGLATAGEALDEGGPEGVGQDLELGEQEAFALAQSQGGFASRDIYIRAIYMDRIRKEDALSTKKKMPRECENAYAPENTGDIENFSEKLRNRCQKAQQVDGREGKG